MKLKKIFVALMLVLSFLITVQAVSCGDPIDDAPSWEDGGCQCCPNLYIWDGNEYAYETWFDLEGTSDIVVSHVLSVTPEVVDGFYLLRLEEANSNHIDRVKLSYKIGCIEFSLPPIEATHSSQGNVLIQLAFSDDWRVDMESEDTIDLKFLAIPNAHAFTVEGYSP